MNRQPSRTDPENLQYIHQRYEDAALVIFRQEQKKGKEPDNTYLSFGETSKHYSYSTYGNASVIVKKSGRQVTKMDEKPINSAFCVIM